MRHQISEAKTGEPQLYFLCVETGDLNPAILVFDGWIGDYLAQLALKSFNVAKNSSHYGNFALASCPDVCVDRQVAFVSSLNRKR